jgi:predicted glutamine amidotransferase
MCRLLGFVSHQPVTLRELLGADELTEFTELSRKHADGWGFAWARDDGVEVTKAADAAYESALFAKVATEQRAELGLLHLRWATLGLELAPENTHPFADGRIAFHHNGSVKPPQALDALIPAQFAALRKGTTDSERYFLALLAAASEADPATALERTALRICAECEFSSLNAMTITPDQLQVINLFDPLAEGLEAEPDYYRIGYRVEAGSVLVTSSGWGSGWSYLENGEMLTVDRATCDVTIRRVAAAPVAS